MVSLGERRPPPGDLASLSELDEASLLDGLRERFLRQQVYTDIGDILVAMNPFQPLPLYGREVSERYRHPQTSTLPPHIFAVASRAYHAMLGHRGGGPQSQCIVIRYISGRFGTQDVAQRWKQKYQEVCNALDMVGFQEQEQVDMQAILAGVLSLGNVTFEPEERNGSVKVSEASRGWLKAAAGQFGVQEDELLKCLICTMSVTRGEQIQRFHTQQQAEDARDSIAKVVYGRVFGWIVCKINELLAENVDPEVELSEIGILDIFGFENFAVNRFEQLCINLANEQLQHFFNHHIFQMEQAAYKEEELRWETITFNNNEPILNLLLAKPLGLLSLLDEQSAFPQATDKTFVDKLNSSFKGNSHFQPGRGRVLGFSIIHYAGKMIPGADDKFNSTRKQSAGAQFRHSLMMLMERMYSANPHFVRCIKPNGQKEPGVVDSQVVLLQLRYNGLLETIRIRRDGFSWRPSFEEFAERYGILLVKPDVSLTKERKSRLFFKYWHQEQLAKYVERLERAAVVIQKVFRGFRCKKSYLKLLAELRAQAQRLQEEAERERSRQLAMEAEAQKRISLPVPMPRKRRPQPCPHPPDKLSQPPVPRPRSKLTESTPFDNFLDPSVPRPVLGREEQTREDVKTRKCKRGATLRWFKETQAKKVMRDDGAFPSWLHGMISRREAENLLIDKPLGCFLVRISQSRPGYTLTYRGEGRCRHYMIEMQPNARYVILGEDRAHASLTELVRYHQTVGIQPFMEILTVPCGQKSSESLDYEDLKCLRLGPPEAEGEAHPEEQPCPSRPSTSQPDLQSGASAVLTHMWFKRNKNSQKKQSLDKSRTKPSSVKKIGSQRAFPRLHSSIRLAMQEIQQFSSTALNTFVQNGCEAVRVERIEPE
ncbi:myosin-iiib-like isoform x1 [Limosa lapponica baueri]|uniref:non-specific serine/threonine protein kinase n=1 Tax=Limosa lapponica baueri TaxID=1758121 RepID=A0A2I0U9W6_LIMLA|nr:myosin-iiib-like isoform x1 [Limosa lapponica baueri]